MKDHDINKVIYWTCPHCGEAGDGMYSEWNTPIFSRCKKCEKTKILTKSGFIKGKDLLIPSFIFLGFIIMLFLI